MAGILKLSDRKFKITMNEMLRVLAEKVVNTLVQMDNGSRKVAALWKNHKEMLENKNPLTEMKNALEWHEEEGERERGERDINASSRSF